MAAAMAAATTAAATAAAAREAGLLFEKEYVHNVSLVAFRERRG